MCGFPAQVSVVPHVPDVRAPFDPQELRRTWGGLGAFLRGGSAPTLRKELTFTLVSNQGQLL